VNAAQSQKGDFLNVSIFLHPQFSRFSNSCISAIPTNHTINWKLIYSA